MPLTVDLEGESNVFQDSCPTMCHLEFQSTADLTLGQSGKNLLWRCSTFSAGPDHPPLTVRYMENIINK